VIQPEHWMLERPPFPASEPEVEARNQLEIKRTRAVQLPDGREAKQVPLLEHR
jgi:hypothetical protein